MGTVNKTERLISMIWFLCALVSCAASCGIIEIIRRQRFDPFEALMYRSFIAGFLLLPFFMYIDWPSDLRFYGMMAIVAVTYAWGNIVMSNLAARKNGRVAMLYQPFVIFMTFALWLVISPAEVQKLESHPSLMMTTALCFAVLMIALAFIRKNDYAWQAVIAVVPLAVAYAALNVAQTWFLTMPTGGHPGAGGVGTILAILVLGNFGMVAALPFLSRYRVKTDELSLARQATFPMATLTLLAVLSLAGWGLMLHAMQIADNPAYPVAIKALTPVLFQIYYWIRGWRDHASPVAGAAMTLSALMLGLVHA